MHFGIISPPVPGHLNPMCALAGELTDRAHRVTFFHMPDVEARIRREGFDFCSIGEKDHPLGSLPESLEKLSSLRGLAALRFTIGAVRRTTEMICRDAPKAIGNQGIEALIVDQTEPAGNVVAEHLGLPFVTICNALLLNRETSVPPPFTPWHYRDVWWARLRNRAGYEVSDKLLLPVRSVLRRYRRQWNLPTRSAPDEEFSSLAQISQQTPALDFPRKELPPVFHYAGPFRRAVRPIDSFPWDRLDGRPLVYASLGTLQNKNLELFRIIAEACSPLNVQLVISHNYGLDNRSVKLLERSALVVPYAPQTELLRRAVLTVTHAGMNTVLDSLAAGVPLVAIPITYEQPAIARRLERTGAGKSLPLRHVTAPVLRAQIAEVLEDPGYRAASTRVAFEIESCGGVRRAADIIEQVCNAKTQRQTLHSY